MWQKPQFPKYLVPFTEDIRNGKLDILRDDTHMTSMKIVQFSRPPTPLSIYVQTYFIPLTLDVQFQTNATLSKWWPINEKET